MKGVSRSRKASRAGIESGGWAEGHAGKSPQGSASTTPTRSYGDQFEIERTWLSVYTRSHAVPARSTAAVSRVGLSASISAMIRAMDARWVSSRSTPFASPASARRRPASAAICVDAVASDDDDDDAIADERRRARDDAGDGRRRDDGDGDDRDDRDGATAARMTTTTRRGHRLDSRAAIFWIKLIYQPKNVERKTGGAPEALMI